MNADSDRRITAGAGIFFVITAVVGGFIPGAPPKPDDAISKVMAFYTDNHAKIIVSCYLAGISSILILAFLGALLQTLRRAGDTVWTGVAFGAGLVTTAVFTVQPAFAATAAWEVSHVPNQTSETVVRLLNDVANLMPFFGVLTLGAFGLAAGLAILRTGALPGWVGGLALVTAAGSLVASFGIFQATGPLAPAGFLGLVLSLFLFSVWIIAASITMIRGGSTAEVVTANA